MVLFTGEAAAIPLLSDGIGSNIIHLFWTGSYISLTLTEGIMPAPVLPPITYNFSSATAEAVRCLAVGIGSFVVHELSVGEYASFVLTGLLEENPPTAYKMPLIKAAVKAPLAVGIGFPSCH